MMVLSNVPWDRPWQYSSQRKRKREFKSCALENLPFPLASKTRSTGTTVSLISKIARIVTAFLIESSDVSALLPSIYVWLLDPPGFLFSLSRESLSKRLIILLITFFSRSQEFLFFPSEIRKRRQPIKARNSPGFFVATSSRVLSS